MLGLLSSSKKSSGEFVDSINQKWGSIKAEISLMNRREASGVCIRRKASLRRICLSSIIEFCKDNEQMSAEGVFEEMSLHYTGGLENLRSEHPEIMEDARTLVEEGADLGGCETRHIYLDVAPVKAPLVERRKKKVKKILWNLFPPLTWVPPYYATWKDNVRGDVTAGFTIAILEVPQALAYATIAGLPPIFGLYTTLMSISMYIIFGTCKG